MTQADCQVPLPPGTPRPELNFRAAKIKIRSILCLPLGAQFCKSHYSGTAILVTGITPSWGLIPPAPSSWIRNGEGSGRRTTGQRWGFLTQTPTRKGLLLWLREQGPPTCPSSPPHAGRGVSGKSNHVSGPGSRNRDLYKATEQRKRVPTQDPHAVGAQ